jgi:hypothetical protein
VFGGRALRHNGARLQVARATGREALTTLSNWVARHA